MLPLLVTRRLALATLALAGLAAAYLLLAGAPLNLAVPTPLFSVGLHLDLPATVFTAFVGLLVWLVATYSLTNLAGQPGGRRFAAAMSVALLGLVLMVAGASLPVIAVGWTLSGLAASWLVAHPATPAARRSAMLLRRTMLPADLALWSAVLLAALILPSLDRASLGESLTGLGTLESVALAAPLALAAAVRSALVPAHRWLIETAEAPSPVSAFLHAGIVNGGGVLLVLLWPMLAPARPVLVALVLAGALSVVVGTWASRARDDVKGRLACSTTAQLGYVAVQVGLGIPAAALLHVVGHGAWKSWLFLRAGGAIERVAASSTDADAGAGGRRTAGAARRLALLLTLAVATVVGLPAALLLVAAAGPVAVVPVSLSLLLALALGRELARVQRTAARTRLAAAALAGGGAAATLWVLHLWKEWLTPSIGASNVWSGPAAWALVSALALAGLAAFHGAHRVRREPTGRLAVALLPTALSPGLRSPGAARWPSVTAPAAPGKRALTASDAALAARVATRVTGAAWPLRSSVAVNPVAPLESVPFDEAVDLVRRTHGADLLPDLDWYLDRWAVGRITPTALLHALEEAGGPHGWLPQDSTLSTDVGGFVRTSQALLAAPDPDHRSPAGGSPTAGGAVPRAAEALADPAARQRVTALADQEAGWWCQRSWAAADATGPGPWQRWRLAAARAGYGRASGLRGVAPLVTALPEDPAEAVAAMAHRAGLPGPVLVGYLTRLLSSGPGWAAHAAWREDHGQPGALLQLLALRMALDLLHCGAAGGEGLDLSPAPTAGGWCGGVVRDAHRRTWQRALELSVGERLLPALVHADDGGLARALGRGSAPLSQSLWCIDVRSERVRRQLEASGRHETFGVAGFFGVLTRHRDADGRLTDQCPVLVDPSSASRAAGADLGLRQVLHRAAVRSTSAPLVPLLTAEVVGLAAAAAAAGASLLPARSRSLRERWTRGHDHLADPEWLVDLETRVAAAEGTLRSIGLVDTFAPVIVLVGHGATTENNAHAATYQCGACGANPGLVNARLMAHTLNDRAVREGLRRRGIHIPSDSVAVAGLHDTTLDTVTLVREGAGAPPAWADPGRIEEVQAALSEAGRRTARERVRALPRFRPDLVDTRPADPGVAAEAVARRAQDWAQPTPEWGLAGNQAIIVAPRRLTAGLDLGGRVFLHSYERAFDPDHRVLEQLLTAPVVVSQWISSQYQLSAAAPEVFGAGDKTTLNVVGDVGVLGGAHGDLRIGLPWQALFTHAPGAHTGHGALADPGAHEPVRHLIVVAADREAVRDVVRRHDSLHQLVAHRWATVVVLDQGAHELRGDLTWRTWVPAAGQERVTQVAAG